VRQKRGDVFRRGGTYYLPEPLVFTGQDSGTKRAPVVFQNYQNEKPVISGGVKLVNLDWRPYTNGIFQAQVPQDLQTDPPAGLDLSKAVIEATRLRNLVEFRGDDKNSARFISLRGLTFRHAAWTVMDTREPLLRSEWAVYRGGAVFFNGAEDCTLEDSFLDQLGGNAVFVNNYNRRVTIRDRHIDKACANGICFVGDPKAARSPLFNYNQRNRLEDNYPADCLVDDCLIHETGRVEKQTAPIEIDLAQTITVRHWSIYEVPRAGINIGDGCWGGKVIEFCDIFDTVKETQFVQRPGADHRAIHPRGRRIQVDGHRQ